MKIEEVYSDLFGFSKQTYFNWLREKRKVILFFKNYFSKNEIQQIDENGRLVKLEEIMTIYQLTNRILMRNLKGIQLDFLTDFYHTANQFHNNLISTIKKEENDLEAQMVRAVLNLDAPPLKSQLILILKSDESKQVLCNMNELTIEILYSLATHYVDFVSFRSAVRNI